MNPILSLTKQQKKATASFCSVEFRNTNKSLSDLSALGVIHVSHY